MRIRIQDYEGGNVRNIEYLGTVSLFVNVHYAAWGFYRIIKTGRERFAITDIFTGELIAEISKAPKGATN